MSAPPTRDPFPTRRVGPACLSDLVLDRLMLGELDAPTSASARTHLDACDACARALAHIEAEARRFAAEVDIPALAARAARTDPPRSSWLRRLRERFPRTVAFAPAFAAVTITAVGLLAARPGVETDGSRTKGSGFGIAAYVVVDGAGAPYAGQRLASGDRVAFRVSSQRPGYVVLVALDERGAVSQYYPPGNTPERVEAGADVPLRTAVELDDAPGREVVIAVRCDAALPPQRAIDAARIAAERARGTGRPPLEVGDLGLRCAEARVVLHKAAGQ